MELRILGDRMRYYINGTLDIEAVREKYSFFSLNNNLSLLAMYLGEGADDMAFIHFNEEAEDVLDIEEYVHMLTQEQRVQLELHNDYLRKFIDEAFGLHPLDNTLNFPFYTMLDHLAFALEAVRDYDRYPYEGPLDY